MRKAERESELEKAMAMGEGIGGGRRDGGGAEALSLLVEFGN